MPPEADFVYIQQKRRASEGNLASVCTVGMLPEADFVYIHRRGLREAVRIELNETIEGRDHRVGAPRSGENRVERNNRGEG